MAAAVTPVSQFPYQFHHPITADTAETMLNSSTRAQLPVIPRIRPKAPPRLSIKPLGRGPPPSR